MILNEKSHWLSGKGFKTRVSTQGNAFVEDVTCGVCGKWLLERQASWIDGIPYCRECL